MANVIFNFRVDNSVGEVETYQLTFYNFDEGKFLVMPSDMPVLSAWVQSGGVGNPTVSADIKRTIEFEFADASKARYEVPLVQAYENDIAQFLADGLGAVDWTFI